MEECEGCARRRKEAALMVEAVKAWALNPLGPNIQAIYVKLRAEAVARGDFDAA